VETYNSSIKKKLLTYLILKLDLVEGRTGKIWWTGNCPDCGGAKKFGVNMRDNRTNCFKCGYNKPPIRMLCELENLPTFNDARKYLGAFDETSIYEAPQEILEERRNLYPESYRVLMLGESMVSDMARKYMEKRGFDIIELSYRGIGYCVSGPYAYRIILPFLENGELIYFNARQFINMSTKFKNPSLDEFGIGKSVLIYNSDALKTYKEVTLFESITNSLTLGDDTIAIGGKAISPDQKSQILSSKVKIINIGLDPDAMKYAWSLAYGLHENFKVRVLKFPKEEDANSMGKDYTRELIEKTPILTIDDSRYIYKKLLRYS